jgi:DNA-binding NarL/FixJ family response regulator
MCFAVCDLNFSGKERVAMGFRIILADDHKLVRQGLRSLIENESDMTVIAEADDGISAVKLAAKLSPDIILMDISMPGLNGLEATRLILAEGDAAIKIIALSMNNDRKTVSQMLNAGVSGYVLKDSAFEDLVSAIHTVAANSIYLSPTINEMVLKDYVQRVQKEEFSLLSLLTSKERETLQLLTEGKKAKEIASILNMSLKTVEAHRQQIMTKLDIHSIAELTKFAVREGLTTP